MYHCCKGSNRDEICTKATVRDLQSVLASVVFGGLGCEWMKVDGATAPIHVCVHSKCF